MVAMLELSCPWTKQRVVALAMPSAEQLAVLTAAAKLYLVPVAAPARVLAALKPRLLRVRVPPSDLRLWRRMLTGDCVDRGRCHVGQLQHVHHHASPSGPLR